MWEYRDYIIHEPHIKKILEWKKKTLKEPKEKPQDWKEEEERKWWWARFYRNKWDHLQS